MANAPPITFGSVCTGIEAASVALGPLGFVPVWLSEIDPFASAVLAHHYPAVPNLGDMTTIARRVLAGDVAAPDVLCGGTPCQAFSVAGLRNSLAEFNVRLLQRPRDPTPGPKARKNQRRAIATAQREALQACITDIPRKARETPDWVHGYNSAITAIEQQLSKIKD